MFGDASYTLSGCIHGSNSHFVSITRNFRDKMIYFCDGMDNNSQFVKLPLDNIPFDHKIYRLSDALYIRDDYVRL